MERKFFIAGVKFHDLHKVIKEVEVGQTLTLKPDPTNKYDPNAIEIWIGETMVGFVPKKFSAEVAALLGVDLDIECVVTQVNPSAKTWEQCEVIIRETLIEAGPDIGDGPDFDSGCKE